MKKVSPEQKKTNLSLNLFHSPSFLLLFLLILLFERMKDSRLPASPTQLHTRNFLLYLSTHIVLAPILFIPDFLFLLLILFTIFHKCVSSYIFYREKQVLDTFKKFTIKKLTCLPNPNSFMKTELENVISFT